MGVKSSTVEMVMLDRVSIPANQVIAALGRTRAAAMGLTGVNRSAAMSAGFLGTTLGKLGAMAAGYFSVQTLREAVKVHAEEAKAWSRIGYAAGASKNQIAAAREEAVRSAMAVGVAHDEIEAAMRVMVTGTGRTLEEAGKYMKLIGGVASVTGATTESVAKVADAMDRILNIKGPEQQARAFEMMNNAAKAGRVQINDMVTGLPHLAEAAQRFGYTGEKGLAKLLTLIEAMSARTADAGEAMSQVEMIIGNMTSQRQAKRFEKLGVDITGMMVKAAKKGTDQLEVVANAIWRAIGGKMENLPKLFPQAELQTAARNLLAVYGKLGDTFGKVKAQSNEMRDNMIDAAKNPAAALQNLHTAWRELLEGIGAVLHSGGAVEGLKWMADQAKRIAEGMVQAADAVRYMRGQPMVNPESPKGLGEFWDRADKAAYERQAAIERASLEAKMVVARTSLERVRGGARIGDMTQAEAIKMMEARLAKLAEESIAGTPAEQWLRQRREDELRQEAEARGGVREAPPPLYYGTGEAWPRVEAPPIEGVEEAGADAGAKVGDGFIAALREKLRMAKDAFGPEINALKDALGFTVSPTITPKVTPQSYQPNNQYLGGKTAARARGLYSDHNWTAQA